MNTQTEFRENKSKPMSDAEFFGSLTLIIAALIALKIFFA